MFESRVLRKVFGPNKDEVTGKWRRLHNEELYDLYSLLHVIRVIKSRRMSWERSKEPVADRRGAYGVLVGRPGGRRPLGRPRRRWENNIKN
jgi:hypothetical protein